MASTRNVINEMANKTVKKYFLFTGFGNIISFGSLGAGIPSDLIFSTA
jgi:hypothetical protein